MRKTFYLLLLAVGLSQFAFGQLTGTYTIPGAPYATIASAITALNTSGVGAGGVTFNVTAGYTETFASPTAGTITTNTGTAANQIIFQKSGAGADPKITAATGTGTMDAIITLAGVQYVTFNGIDVYENAANLTATTQMEWGYAVLKNSATQGSQNITIKNCTISLNNTNMGTWGIYSNNHTSASVTSLTVTAVTGQNSNNKFYGNTITNCYNGIYLYGYADATAPYAYYDQNNDIGSLTGNTINNFGGGANAEYMIYVYYQNGVTIANSNISGTSATGNGNIYGIYGGTATNANASIYGNTVAIVQTAATTGYIYGIYSTGLGTGGTTNTVNIYNNTVQNCQAPASTTSYFYGIYYSATAMTINFYGNTVNNNVFGGSYYMYLAYCTSTAGGTTNVYNNTVSNNSRSGLGTQSGSAYLYCLYVTGSGSTVIHDNNVFGNSCPAQATYSAYIYGLYCSNSATSQTVYNNSVHDQTITSSYTSGHALYGIYSYPGSGGVATNALYNNNVYNLTITNSSSGYGYIYGIYGYYMGNIYNNNLYNVTVNSATGYGYGYGIYFGGAGAFNVYKNRAYNISMAGASGYFYTMYITAPTTANVYNNFLSDIRTPASTSTSALHGIYISSGTTVNMYYNTVYLNCTNSSATTFGSDAVYVPTGTTAELRNNILINTSTAPGSTTYSTAAYRRSSTTLTSYTNASNNNDFYAGTPSTTNLIMTDGTNNYQTLAAYKAAVTPRDMASITELPPFVNIATTPYDLHMKTTIATQCESGGANVATFTNDYDGDIRQGNAGYTGSGSAPDIGADEFNGILMDLTPPSIAYTPFLNTNLFTARTLTTTISDASGVPTSGAGLPRLYWKINAGAYSSVAGTFVSGNTYTFTFGAGVVLNDVVSYYIVAQDGYSTPNVGSNPSTGAAGYTANPPAAGTPPTPNTYTIVGNICGTFNVGVGQTYTTLTAAINDLNNKYMTCAVKFILTDATYPAETFPISINANPGASAVNTLTIKPNTGITATLTGSANSAPLIKVLNSYTTIDGSNTAGGSTRNLTISNTSVTAPNILLLGSTGTTPLVNCTIANCILINGVNTNSGVFVSDAATLGNPGYFNNIIFQNNSVQLSYIALYVIANPATGNGSGMVITGNDFSTSGANSIRLVPIYVQGVDGLTVSNNTIGNIVNTLDASNETGIWLATATVNATISGNTISGMSGSAGAPRGIAISSGVPAANIVINNNNINNISTASTGSAMGIYFFSTTSGCNISNNQISNVKNSNTGGWLASGLYLASTAAVSASCTVINNAIWDVASYGYSSYTWNANGIVIYSGFGYNVYHNTVYMNTDQTIAGIPSALFVYSSVTNPGAIDLRDNIFTNAMTIGTERYTIYCLAANTVFSNIDYNDYFTTGSNLGYIGSARATLTDLQTGFGGNLNSQSLNPTFVGANLHPTNMTLGKKGVYFASVPTDLAGTTRTNPPDMGVYEFGPTPTVITLAATPISSTTATLNGSINANAITTNSFFDYGLTTAYGTSTAAVPASVSGSTVTGISLPITGLTALTTYHYRARGVTTGGMIIWGNDMTFTTTSPPPTVVTTAATAITGTTATLNGTVNANSASSTVSFDYGLTVAYGTNVPGVPVTITGSTAQASLANITGLAPNTLYHFRINGTNVGGTTNGGDLTFTTAAIASTVTTTAATAITTTGATVNGIVNANNSLTTVYFDYGLTVAYGTTVNGVPPTVSGAANTNVSAVLTGLTTATTYHYRVRGVNGAGTANGNDMTFLTGCPAVAAAGAITGPASVCANATGNVYTVGAITNAVSYSWTLPAGAAITAGSGTNTITVAFGATSGNITVAGVGVCMTGTASTYAVTVNALPVPTIAGPASPCVNSTANVYTTQAGMTGYTWTVSAGGAITAGATTSAITVTWSTTGAKTVTVSYTNANGCTAAAPTTYAVTVNPLPTPTITGTATLCQGTTGVVYTTQAGMTNYVWTVSAGGLVTAGGTATSNTVTVTWNNSGAQSVSVNYANANGCVAAAATVFNVTVNPTPVPTIGSNNAPCVGSTGNMYYTDGGMTNYTWTVSAGGAIASGQGTSAINVTWTGVGAQAVTVSYTNTTGCTSVTPSVYSLFVNPLPNAAGAVTGTATLCAGTNGVAYSCGDILNATSYTWTLPAGATIATGAGTKNITVNFGPTAVSGNITVAGTNSCGNGTSSPAFAVTVNPLPAAAGTVTGSASVCAGATGVAYSVPTIANAATYVWTVPAGATITSGASTKSIVVTFGATAGTGVVNVKGTNTCGNGAVSADLNVTIHAIPAAPVVTANGSVLTSSATSGNQWYYAGNPIAGATSQTYTVTHNTGYYWCVVTTNGCSSPISNKVWVVVTGIGSQSLASEFVVYPNPNKGQFTISLDGVEQGTYTIEVMSNLGVAIWKSENVMISGSYKTEVDIRPAPAGVYMVLIRNNESHQVRKVMVNN